MSIDRIVTIVSVAIIAAVAIWFVAPALAGA
jgi:hypothetical protein